MYGFFQSRIAVTNSYIGLLHLVYQHVRMLFSRPVPSPQVARQVAMAMELERRRVQVRYPRFSGKPEQCFLHAWGCDGVWRMFDARGCA